MDFEVNEDRKRVMDDEFDAFSMLAQGNFVSLYDVEARLTRYSPGAVELFSLPGEYIPDGAYDWIDYVHPEDRKRYSDTMERLLSGRWHSYDISYRVRMQSGEYASFRFLGAVIRSVEGRPSLVGGMMINQGLLDNVDPITVLRNKHAFFTDLAALLKTDAKLTVLLLGTSGLTAVNETHGYSFGNRVLQQLSWIIQESVGERGSVYRMDDAAFAIVSQTMGEAEMAALYDTLRAKLQRGIRVDGVRAGLFLSGGMISTRGFLMDPGAIYSSLTFAYRVSRESKYGELVDFNGSADRGAGETLDLIGRVRESILDDCRGFYLRYQPVVNLQTGKTIGVETLLRWRDERLGEVLPMAFLPVLERDFLFEELATWILRRALRDGVRFLEKDPGLLLGLNISVTQLENEYFLDELFQLLDDTRFPAGNLVLELTEACRLLGVKRLSSVTGALAERGVRVIIDNFGSGMDSIETLRAIPTHCVKADLKLIRDLEENEADRRTLRCLADIAIAHGSSLLVKGVETAAVSEIVRSMPVRSAQGNFYGEPLACEEAIARYLA